MKALPALWILSVLSAAPAMAAPAQTAAELAQGFAEPPMEARPWTRWWWHNGAATREEIARELKLMRDAGFGGAEICTLDAKVIPEVPGQIPTKLGTPERATLYVAAVEEAAKLGLSIDITPATKWPYNGSWVTSEFSPQSLEASEITVTGPKSFSGPVPPAKGKVAVLEALVLSQPGKAGIIVTAQVRAGNVTLDIPAGDWKLTAYWRIAKGGPVINHFSAEAMRRHLDWAIKPTLDALPKSLVGTAFRGVYCDNIEGFWGESWTIGLLEEFKKRRGYDLAPYLPIMGVGEEKRNDTTKESAGGGDMRGRLQYDFQRTLADVQREGCFVALREWCHAHGLLARAEGHIPARGDLIDNNGAVDIPEMEVYKGGFPASRGADVSRFGGHLYGHNIVSCESFTWLTPHFRASLQDIREAADAIMAVGVNQIVNHGYTYSPPEAGWPGWLFYASSNINHNNPFWPYYRALGDYIARNQNVLRAGRPVVDVAFFGGAASELSNDRTRKADRVSDLALLTQAKVENGVLLMGLGRYQILVLKPEAEVMRLETLRQIEKLANDGASVVALALPADVPGFAEHDKAAAEVKAISARLFPAQASTNAKAIGKGRTWLITATQLEELYQQIDLRPQLTAPEKSALQFEHRQGADFDAFLVFNPSAAPVSGPLKFRAAGAPSLWDAKTGGMTACDPAHLEIPPRAAKLVVFRRDAVGKSSPPPVDPKPIMTIQGPWSVRFESIDGKPALEKTFDPLIDWTTLPETRNFAGTARYTHAFNLATVPAGRIDLDLGKVCEVAQPTLNGKPLAIVFEPPYRIEIPPGVLKAGTNNLSIAVGNRMENGILPLLSGSGKGVKWNKMPIRALDEVGELHPSGLMGPVQIMEAPVK